MKRKSILKLVGLIVFFSLLSVSQPLIKELDRELTQPQLPQVKLTGSTSFAQESQLKPPTIETNVLGVETTASVSAEFVTVYPVVRVVDGDTIKVEINGKIETVRILGINTPETVDPRKAVECFGKEASDQAKILLSNQKVSLEPDITQGDRDRYQRLLRYVLLEDGTDYGLSMIKNGYAYEYLYDIPYKYRDNYVESQKNAAQQKIGLWEDGVCEQERLRT